MLRVSERDIPKSLSEVRLELGSIENLLTDRVVAANIYRWAIRTRQATPIHITIANIRSRADSVHTDGIANWQTAWWYK